MQRPQAVTVFGVLNIAFAAFGLMGLLSSLSMLAMARNMKASTPNPVLKLMDSSPGFTLWTNISIGVGFIFTLVLLASGIGLLKMKSWGRTLSFVYIAYAVIFGILSTVMNYMFLVVPLMEQSKNQQGAEQAAAIGGAVGGMVGGCFGLIYPMLLAFFMMRPNVIAAFKNPEPLEI